MRIFNDLIEAHKEIQRDLYEVGIWNKGHTVQDKVVTGDRGFDFMELSPYLWCYTAPDNLKKLTNFIKHLDLNFEWIAAEFNERLMSMDAVPQEESTLNPGKAWELRREVWEPFIEHDTIHDSQFSYTYAQRFAMAKQLWRVKRELRLHPATRQAVVGVHTFMLDSRNMGVHHRIPCSMFYHFMIREGKLNLHYAMRSCDFHLHFPYDICLAIMMQRTMAKEVGVEVGVFTHFATSLHGFRKDFPEDLF